METWQGMLQRCFGQGDLGAGSMKLKGCIAEYPGEWEEKGNRFPEKELMVNDA